MDKRMKSIKAEERKEDTSGKRRVEETERYGRRKKGYCAKRKAKKESKSV